jgi:hypothetical protein
MMCKETGSTHAGRVQKTETEALESDEFGVRFMIAASVK